MNLESKSIIFLALALLTFMIGCNPSLSDKLGSASNKEMIAEDILGNPEYQAISYGGYRQTSRDIQPTIAELKEDMKILHAMGIRIIRTYHTERPHAANAIKAIDELKKENADFEMYAMVGAWINCANAWTDNPDHEGENADENALEIARAVALANQYPEIVKIIAVGNEAMVKWATSYYVQPNIILKYVNQLQKLKKEGRLNKDLWVTSSDNFASWGGGDGVYHTADLIDLIKAVDYISMHTYPMHDTHYNPDFWGYTPLESSLSDTDKIQKAMDRALAYASDQYHGVKAFTDSLGISKPIYIGETGWASSSNGFYGDEGTRACDEYKEGLYYQKMRDWTNANGISCFYFEAFNEPWKDAKNQGGSENHFGLFTVDGKAKYALWDLVDDGVFSKLTRGGYSIRKTYSGNLDLLLKKVKAPPVKDSIEIK